MNQSILAADAVGESFDYEAVDAAGRTLKGRIAAAHEREALRALEGQGLVPITISRVIALRPTAAAKLGQLTFFQRPPSIQDYVLSLKQMALLLKAGVPLVQAIATLKGQGLHPQLQAAFADIEKRLRAGEAFTSAFTAGLPGLPPYVSRLAASGEAIGHLGNALDDAAVQMAYDHQVRQDIRNALTYPAILVAAGISAVLFIFIVVVPRFTGMLASAKEPLPWLSQVVFKTGMFLNNNTGLVMAVVGGLIAMAAWAAKNAETRNKVREGLTRMPLLGPWLLEADLARWASMLATMLANGVDLIKGLELSRDSTASPTLRGRLDQVGKLVRGGQALSGAIASQRAFNETAVSLVQVGEESGELPTMLRSLAKLYEDSGRQRMKRFLLLLEPAAILLIGLVVGGIVAAIMLAITSVNQIAL